MNTDNNRKLSDEELNQVAGGAGDAMGKWLIGDYFSAKFRDMYYFCELKKFEVYYNGETWYRFESKYTANLLLMEVEENAGKLIINPDDPSTGVVLKKIYDFPAPCRFQRLDELEKYLAKWIR